MDDVIGFKSMKIFIVIVAIVLVAVLMIQGVTLKSSNDIEQYKYTVIETFDGVELRKYERALFSSVVLKDSAYDASANNGFRILAGYIFGGNDRNEKIAMTSPVVMEMGDQMKMSFMVPSDKALDNLPRPNDSRVFQEERAETVMAAITFDGWASDEKIEKYKKELIEVLSNKGMRYHEPFMYMGYNPPYQLVNRRNEVVVRVLN